MAYATPADMIVRYDVRTLGDLLADNGARLNPTQVGNSDTLASILTDASGEIESALLQGKRYSVDDLEDLTGNSLALLKRITCKIAFWMLWERRPYADDDRADIAREDAKKTLEKLRRGENVFNLDAQLEAGLPSVTTPSVASIERLNLTVDHARRGFYPSRRTSAD